ncbi:hypothetical protein SmJEL517_g02027 [Synchytrium microbalum]|uniref:Uncharacterized protein n=1 Tax=Synchytrium microbalum TaxID=1806994 RepID=A0A507CCF7_9FUNG|nr:uncharacterized protein SmJEL517_g02027 [Synchytrium microbalum]TPX35716.1 hypothetical protein SmJEL517_g02027 [Synchytrium microbalum]
MSSSMPSPPPTPGRNVEDSDALPAERRLDDEASVRELVNLLKTIALSDESVTPRERRIATPREMVINLLEHQKLGVEWMLRMETEREGSRGGILADDMGLGKTIQALATFCLNKPGPGSRVKSTLIIAPLALVNQWENEILTKLIPGSFTVYKHQGPKRFRKLEQILQYDIVISTYDLLTRDFPEPKKDKTRKLNTRGRSAADRQDAEDADYENLVAEQSTFKQDEYGPLLKAEWYRVVLDEAQKIKNKTTKGARAAALLKARYRWCLSGTPIENKIDELYPLLKFLAIAPYDDWDKFREEILKPFRNGRHKTALKRVNAILRAVCLRRTKEDYLDGFPIVRLPPKVVRIDTNDFTPPEREFYQAVEQNIRLQFNKYLKDGTVMKNYTNVLVLLLRLRQSCCHPALVAQTFEPAESQNVPVAGGGSSNLSNEQRLAQNLHLDTLNRLKNEELEECPICIEGLVTESTSILANCGHAFCSECIRDFFNVGEGEKCCPSCRGPASEDCIIGMSTVYQMHPSLKRTVDVNDELRVLKDLASSFVSSTKIDRAIGILEETRRASNGDKTIIFSQFLGVLDIVGSALKRRGFKFIRYDGGMSATDRSKAVNIFETDQDCNVALISLKCGSLGLNLTCANHVILMDLWWNPAVESQASDRVHRFGQQKHVFVYRLMINNTVEERILALQVRKKKIFDAAMDGRSLKMKKGEGRLTLEDLVLLFNGEDQENDGSDLTL